MNFLRHLPIKRKLMMITMLACGIALVVACVAFFTYEQVHSRNRIVQSLSITAQMTGANSTAGLAFNEPGSVEQSLKSLNVQPNILRACLYDREGRPFAFYQRGVASGKFVPPPIERTGHRFERNQLKLFEEINLDGDRIGTVYLAMDLSEMTARIWRYVAIVCAVLLASALVAFFLSAKLQKVISDPLTHLAQTVTQVAREKNYSVRATKSGEDEIGRLIEGFNHMLAQIQERDEALRRTQVELEERVMERTQQLANSLSLTQATLESTTDGILVADGQGQVTSYNEKFLEMWRISRAAASAMVEADLLEPALVQLKEPQYFLARVNELYAHPERESFDVLEFTDGRTFERYSKPQRLGERTVGRVWSFRDITERKRSEAELEQVHRQLLESSRQAGMAEVATSVLHNVGNVLNSVNTSASVISELARTSSNSGVGRVAQLLDEHHDDLAVFLTQNGRGGQVIGFLKTLAAELASEQGTVLTELHELTGNIEHIKEIVAMQQSYAKVCGVIEVQSVVALVEDALRMHAGALTRHEVRVVRQFEAVPNLPLDKHKVLQILVNLISNANYALSQASAAPRVLTLGVRAQAGRCICVSVTDNGMGIAAENLTRIFSHGFTTRANGHGFGLHSGALAAREMGGALLVHSGGLGVGATFTLELPLNGEQPAK